jgi:methylenetetrahydrofolate--tRNA-(uracil-5-)-methyltransferase
MGLVVAWMLAAELTGKRLAPPPPTTMLGGLYLHVTAPREPDYKYGPTNVNYGLLPPLPDKRKDNKKPRMSERARADLEVWLAAIGRPALRPPPAVVAASAASAELG